METENLDFLTNEQPCAKSAGYRKRWYDAEAIIALVASLPVSGLGYGCS